MNVEIWTETAQFPEKEYIDGIFVAVQAVRAPIYKLSSIHAYPPSAKLGRTPIKASTLAFSLIASCQQWMAIYTMVIYTTGTNTWLHSSYTQYNIFSSYLAHIQYRNYSTV